MASIKDVARRAGVAPSTVSLVLNNTGYVSEKTREKVEKALKELDYMPNELARNLYRNKTNIIGIIIPHIDHPFFSTFVKYTEKFLYELGYKTMICGTVNRDHVEKEFLELLRRQVMDGIIMGAHTLDVEEYQKINRPLVAIDRYIDANIPIISSDHHKGGVLAANKLISNGCKKVVQIKGATIVNTPAHEYHQSFRDILEKASIEVHDIEMGINCFEPDDFKKVADELFSQYPDVDAILGADLAILACLQKARQLGYEVPGNLKLIAYDGTYMTTMNETIMTSVVQPIEQLAQEAANAIVSLIDGKVIEKQHLILDVELREGQTTI